MQGRGGRARQGKHLGGAPSQAGQVSSVHCACSACALGAPQPCGKIFPSAPGGRALRWARSRLAGRATLRRRRTCSGSQKSRRTPKRKPGAKARPTSARQSRNAEGNACFFEFGWGRNSNRHHQSSIAKLDCSLVTGLGPASCDPRATPRFRPSFRLQLSPATTR